MQIALHTSGRRIVFLASTFLFAAVFLTISTTEFLAFHFSQRLALKSLQWAVRLRAGNAEYQSRLAEYYLLGEQDPEYALPFLKSAVSLNPYEARYWFDLSRVYEMLGNPSLRRYALERAIQDDPTTPDVAWNAANLYMVSGENGRALREFAFYLRSDPYLPAGWENVWRIEPDADAILKNVAPHNSAAYSAFLEFLISRAQTEAASQVWAELAQLNQSVESRTIFAYIHFLIEHQDVAQARAVWHQAARLSALTNYQPSANLIVNGDFSLAMLNGGFDWLYESSPGVSLAVDPSESHLGHRSLAVWFDGSGINDAGIRQFVPADANREYEFSAYFKSQNLEGAGGPRFVLEDAFTRVPYFTSDELKDAEYWKKVDGKFRTSMNTSLLLLGLQRLPAQATIRGRLWIDGVRLSEVPPTGGRQ